MSKVLLVCGHTTIDTSVANKIILDEISKDCPDIEIDALSELYPDRRIDVAAEQAKLLAADLIVLQFPLFWFGTPSMLQQWQEDVFAHGWAYGSTGDRLKGKKVLVSVTVGAPEAAYRAEEAKGLGHDFEEYLLPLKITCAFTGMQYCGSTVTFGVSHALRNDPAQLENIKKVAHDHAKRLEAQIREVLG